MPNEEHGYDESFIDPPSDFLKCVACHLVLRDPVVIVACGHHYCSTCFERIKGYSSHFNSQLYCPIDRQPVDLTKVFKDVCFGRLIDDLQVRCSFHSEGCQWVGELRDLVVHRSQCVLARPTVVDSELPVLSDSVPTKTEEILKEVLDRLERCEEGLQCKEKDVSYLKFQLGQMREELGGKDVVISELKDQVSTLHEQQQEQQKQIEQQQQHLQQQQQQQLNQQRIYKDLEESLLGKLRGLLREMQKIETDFKSLDDFTELIKSMEDHKGKVTECFIENFADLNRLIAALRRHVYILDPIINTENIPKNDIEIPIGGGGGGLGDHNGKKYKFSGLYCTWFGRRFKVGVKRRRRLCILVWRNENNEFGFEKCHIRIDIIKTRDNKKDVKEIISKEVEYNPTTWKESKDSRFVVHRLGTMDESDFKDFTLDDTMLLMCTLAISD